MSDTSGVESGLRLRLDVWHPDCWTLQVTDSVDGGILGHGVHDVDGQIQGRFTAYADSSACLDELLETIETSPHTNCVWVIDQAHGFGDEAMIPGNAFCGLVVAYEETNSINDPLVKRGFIPDAPVRIYDGQEYWHVVVHADKAEAHRRLDEVRGETGAEIEITYISSARGNIGRGLFWHDLLSDRQREAFLLARKRGYYQWPREVSATDLAAELDVSRTTFLEHLRKAEMKLLDIPTDGAGRPADPDRTSAPLLQEHGRDPATRHP